MTGASLQISEKKGSLTPAPATKRVPGHPVGKAAVLIDTGLSPVTGYISRPGLIAVPPGKFWKYFKGHL